MTDVYSGHSQFILLTDNRRRWFDGRTLFLLLVVTLPVILFCGIYTIILRGKENLLYPRSYVEVPYLLTHHAKTYSSHLKSTRTKEIHLPNIENFKPIEEYKLVCYYNFPGDDPNSLQPENINPSLCTHINVGFASIVNSVVDLRDSQLEVLKSIVKLKKINDKLKVLISVGGAANDGGFDVMSRNHTNRKSFIRSVLNLVKNFGIDGVDLDWEFPNQNSPNDNQQLHFTQLLQEFRMTINKQSKHKFLLTVAVAAPLIIIDNSYKVQYMDEYVDFVNVMTYDFHFYTKITPFTGLNSPLYATYDDKGYFSTLNINYSVHYWLSKGMSREKIIIGLPTYGHTFRLTNPHNKGLYAPARGYGKLGSGGFVDYTQVCKFLNLNQISPVFDLDSKSPYASKSTEWVSFDNEQSLSFKAEYVRDYQFGGVMVYALNADDHMGACKIDPNVQNRPFPLINKIHEVLGANYSIF